MLTKVYPNPSPGIFTLELAEVKPGTDIHVYNMAGEGVWADWNTTSTKQTIDLSNQSSGVYFL
ncbi:MAG: T9SS type A sorting domain-containing protein, partial [Bacteroidetes bacterium]|nr:T9SS type A sorting domain-containing protein [Bacteroidota bacterium]